MRLSSGTELRERLGLGKVDRFVRLADDSADEAMLCIESDLRTPLGEASYSDSYQISLDDYALEWIKFKLTAGFVDPDTLAVGTGPTIAAAKLNSDLTAYATLLPKKGVVHLSEGSMEKFISIRYTAGFVPLAAPDDDLLDVTGYPWLQRASELKGSALIGDSPDMKNKDGNTVDSKAFERTYQRLITPHIRYTPDARLPIR